MIGKIKKFDKKLFDKYDTPAREIIKNKFGDSIIDNSDIYGEDMIFVNKDIKYKFLEIQVCAEWINNKYPHELPFVFERKGHFADETLFILFDKNFIRGMIFGKQQLEKTPVRTKKYSRHYKYNVQLHKVSYFMTDDLCIDDIYIYQTGFFIDKKNENITV